LLLIELGNSAPLLTRWGTTSEYGHWNSKKIVESYSYKLVCFGAFPAGLQKLGQRTNGGWPNGQKKRTDDGRQRAGVSVQVSGNKREKAGTSDLID